MCSLVIYLAQMRRSSRRQLHNTGGPREDVLFPVLFLSFLCLSFAFPFVLRLSSAFSLSSSFLGGYWQWEQENRKPLYDSRVPHGFARDRQTGIYVWDTGMYITLKISYRHDPIVGSARGRINILIAYTSTYI